MGRKRLSCQRHPPCLQKGTAEVHSHHESQTQDPCVDWHHSYEETPLPGDLSVALLLAGDPALSAGSPRSFGDEDSDSAQEHDVFYERCSKVEYCKGGGHSVELHPFPETIHYQMRQATLETRI